MRVLKCGHEQQNGKCMSYSDDNGVAGFLGLMLLGIVGVAAYQGGKRKAYNEVADANRDNEIADLKRQLLELKSK